MDGVQSAVAELNEQTLGMDMEQKIKRIHDYICQRVTYRNDNTLWVHSAASLFLDADPAFVCEGYAKSMKIFCYYMGINCACISGTARGTSSGTPGAHMWNYVQMDNGNWYLVDATWDDVGTPPSSRYLLVGRSTKGQYITIGEERVEYTSFSTTSAETAGPVFILPVLAEESYAVIRGKNEPAVTVVPTVTPTAAVSAEPTPTVSVAPTPTVSVKPIPIVSAEPTPTASVAPIPTVSVTPIPTATPVPTATPTPTTTTLTLRVKQTYKSGGKIKSVRTTNKKIVKVDKKGKITGKKSRKSNGNHHLYQRKPQDFPGKSAERHCKTTSVSVNKRNIILAKKRKKLSAESYSHTSH